VLIRKLGRITKDAREMSETMKIPARAAARERYIERMRGLVARAYTDATGGTQPSPDKQHSTPEKGREPESGAAPTSREGFDKAVSSSLGIDVSAVASLMPFLEPQSGSSGPPLTEEGTIGTDTSACITPVEEFGPMVALEKRQKKGNGGEEKERSGLLGCAIGSSFEVTLASSGPATTTTMGTRVAYRGTPMPFRTFGMSAGSGSTDPADAGSSEALADILKRKKSHALAQASQTSEREDDSDGLEILAV